MRLIPRELDKLILRQAGLLAQQRLSRGIRLNYPEACALVVTVCLELIRDGNNTVSELMSRGRTILGRIHVLPNVIPMLHEIQVEGTFRDGTKLLTIHNPIATENGNLTLALYGSGLTVPSETLFLPVNDVPNDPPGCYKLLDDDIFINKGRDRIAISVTNTGDRPIQVGSHYHFIETNKSLSFDRGLAYGKRLNIPAGTSVRFEPGDTKHVVLVNIAGKQVISGGNNLATGPVNLSRINEIVRNLQNRDFMHVPQLETLPVPPGSGRITRSKYADLFGPTVGDKVRLGDSSLYLEIEHDFTVYGDECVFGGGKVIREGMGQATWVKDKDALDLIITNAIIVDYTGIIKADIGIKNGYIAGIGKAGNPDVMEGVSPELVVGPTTEVLSAENCIVTAGAIDTHIHFICVQLTTEALAHGITTLIGGGTGPNTGTNATTCTPGISHIKMMMQSTDDLPLNFGFTGKGNASSPEGLVDMVEAGAVGLKLHEDWGTTPAAIDACLTVCDKYDVQATIHTDTLNESGYVESTLNSFKGRTIHAYHAEGAGGGHCPDLMVVCGHPNVIPSSTNPTRPYTVNTVTEHLDMLMVCHHLNKAVPEDIAFAESRIRGETMGAEDVLHDIGAMSIISSDSQAMGRVGEVVTRIWQTADKCKKVRGTLNEDDVFGQEKDPMKTDCGNDNFRIKRYVSKYTINPAIAHGLSHIVGSIEVGKLADLVVYKPAFFGTKPELVLKGGQIVWAMMGDANASIPTPEPVYGRPQYASLPNNLRENSVLFCSEASLPNVSELNLKKKMVPVRNCRQVSKRDMKYNCTLPEVKVDPESYNVHINDKLVEMAPCEDVCMAQSYFLF